MYNFQLRLVLLLHTLMIVTTTTGQNQNNDESNVVYDNLGQNGKSAVASLPQEATLDGKVTKLDDLSPIIFLNRTKAALNCAAGSMQVELKFNQPFYGIAYADFDRNSACQVQGKGAVSYKLDLPLKGCATRQEPQRVFTNNVVVRFHPSLEMDGDEIITIVCRYPPPIAPISPIPLPIKEASIPIGGGAGEPPLKGFQILLIICGILFLTLLLLGLGCSYYCLQRRPFLQMHSSALRRPFSTIGTDSEITKLSGSSLGTLSMFEGLKIPRAHPPIGLLVGNSGSISSLSNNSDVVDDGGHLISVGHHNNHQSDTLPSDYPSESDEIGEDARSLPISSAAGSYENRAFAALAGDTPTFDVAMFVKPAQQQSPSGGAALSLSFSDSSEQSNNYLSTIPEQYEDQSSIRSMSPSMVAPSTTTSTIYELLPKAPKHFHEAPTCHRIRRKHAHSNNNAPLPPPPPPIVPKTHDVIDVDDVTRRTVIEKRTVEDVERHRRLITEFHQQRNKNNVTPPPRWDIKIQQMTDDRRRRSSIEPPEWENFSDISDATSSIASSQIPNNNNNTVAHQQQHQRPLGDLVELNSPEMVKEFFNLPLENAQVPNWHVLLRVLEENPTMSLDDNDDDEDDSSTVIDSAATYNAQLTLTDKMKWRQIITTESRLRTMLTEAVVREDFERIRQTYQTIFDPPTKWDVIIRILASAPAHAQSMEKRKSSLFKKKATDGALNATQWDQRSRRSSLPTLYEYDDGGFDTLDNDNDSQEKRHHHHRSMHNKSEADLRSMSEMTVDFGHRPIDSCQSDLDDSSFYQPDKMRTNSSFYADSENGRSCISQPRSLARSASEFTERWIAPSIRYDTDVGSEFTDVITPEVTPKMTRRKSNQNNDVVMSTTSITEVSKIRETKRSFLQPTSSSSRPSDGGGGGGWFGDNESDN